jgi:eukaryotic-like serine/threonine-protein kinase
LLVEVGAWDAALQLSESFARRFPKALEASLLEAEACIGLRHGRRAEGAIATARALQPKSPEPDLLLAKLRELQGDLPGATAALGDALKKDPRSLKVARRQGYLLSQRGRLSEAESVLRRALKRDFDAETAAELGFVLYRMGGTGEAKTLLRRALKARPRLARAHYYLGAVLFREGDAAGAERAYLEAEKWAPEDPRPLVGLCELLTRRGRPSEAAAVQARIRERFPENAATLVARCGGAQ